MLNSNKFEIWNAFSKSQPLFAPHTSCLYSIVNAVGKNTTVWQAISPTAPPFLKE